MTWPPHRPPLTEGQRALRWALLLAGLLAVVATAADWQRAAAVLFIALALLLGVSLGWEWATKRHYRAQRKPFEQEADDLLRSLFGDPPA